MIYLQPTYGNPTGVCLSPSRRARVLELAAQRGAFVIEDDYARDLGVGAPPAPLARTGEGRVIYVRSLTKTGAPGLRVAAIVAFGSGVEPADPWVSTAISTPARAAAAWSASAAM